MFLFQREIATNNGWEFIAYVENAPHKLLDPSKEYKYFFITNEM